MFPKKGFHATEVNDLQSMEENVCRHNGGLNDIEFDLWSFGASLVVQY